MAHTILAPTTTVSDFEWTVDRAEANPPAYRWEIIEGVLYTAATPYWPIRR